MFCQVIVVEGIHDEAKVKEVFPDAFCVITNGSEISSETLDLIKTLSLDHEIVIFTDPDYPGERIRKMVMEVVANATHAFLKKDKCISKNRKKVGIEHASKEDIKEALSHLLVVKEMKSDVKMSDLVALGLQGSASASVKRDLIAAKLNIGKPNAKTFLNRVRMFGLTYETLKRMVGELDETNWIGEGNK